jgi:D-3-phosphoglycerate dehydrogenase
MDRTIFISSDHIVDPWLEVIARELQAQGHRILRGPAQMPPAITEFASADWPRFFGATDLILMTSRSKVPREILAAAPRLRGIVFPSIGTESLDLAAATELGIIVAYGPTPENFLSMAEATVMLMTVLFHDLRKTEAVLRENQPRPRVLHAQLMMGRTIGLIGMGRIARAVVERLAGWRVRILAFDPHVSQAEAPPGVEMTDLPSLLRQSDLVSLHVTLSSETRHLIGQAELALMKPSAYLINTARGGLVDDAALVDALRVGRLAGAALDVFQQEPLPRDHPYRELKNVILTPHMVGHTREVFDAIPPTALENIGRIFRGELPLYPRNPEVLSRWHERLARLDEGPAAHG